MMMISLKKCIKCCWLHGKLCYYVIDGMNFIKIFRYNGYLPPCDKGRRRSKFVLYRRQTCNGVKPARHYVVRTPQNTQVKIQFYFIFDLYYD